MQIEKPDITVWRKWMIWDRAKTQAFAYPIYFEEYGKWMVHRNDESFSGQYIIVRDDEYREAREWALNQQSS